MGKTIVIIGGVAGGASAATRARRLDETANIIVLERGPYPSFANCGLPYYISREIPDRSKLIVQTADSLRRRFQLDVRTGTEAVRIDPDKREVTVRAVAASPSATAAAAAEQTISYDDLILATGAAPLRPPIPGIDRPGHFTLRNIPDVDQIDAWVAAGAKRAVVVGGGYIGLEMAEQLKHRGLDVTIVEALPQVMGPLDIEMAGFLHSELRRQGVTLHLSDGVSEFAAPAPGPQAAQASDVVLKSGTRVSADIVILGIGVRPEVALAKAAGLALGKTGAISVDAHLRTSDPHIWAIGDAIEVTDVVTASPAVIPLAGPANRQGRIVADNIIRQSGRTYRGTQGTAILRLFGLSAGCTGASEKALQRAGKPYQAIHLHPGSHAGYFPGAKPIALKLIFDPTSGRVLGAQAVGEDGVDKRIDVLATAIYAGLTVDQLAELELAYAPPYGSAKDPVNLAGMIACNVRAGDVTVAHWNQVDQLRAAGAMVLDVRDRSEWDRGHLEDAVHIPLDELRGRLAELPKDRTLLVHCQSGQRSYNACRLLMQHGFTCQNLSGAWRTLQNAPLSPSTAPATAAAK